MDLPYRELFERSPNAYMVIDRAYRYLAANATYLKVTGSRLDDLLGHSVFERFPHDPADPANAQAARLRASFDRVFASGEPDTLPLIPYRVPLADRSRDEVRLWSATHVPIAGPDGEVAAVLQHTVDVTPLAGAPSVAGEPNEHLAAGVLSRANQVQEVNSRLVREYGNLRTLFEQAPGFMAFLEGPHHVFCLANAAYLRLVGREVVGRRARDVLPELADQGFFDLLDGVYRTGTPHVGQGVPVLLASGPDGRLEESFVDFVFQPVSGASGVDGIFVQGSDVTSRVHAERATGAALRAAEAFSTELVEQSERVRDALQRAERRIRELERPPGS